MTKSELRSHIAAARAALSRADWQRKSDAITAHVCQSALYQGAACLFTYYSIRGEADTHALIRQAWADGKRVAVPVTAANGQMLFAPYTPHTALHKTPYGTFEPHATPQEAVCPTESDLFLAPGLVFDAHGNRYGYGGGFYDRYCAQHAHTHPIALAFALQVSPTRLSAEAHDRPVHAIVTENGWVPCTPHGA